MAVRLLPAVAVALWAAGCQPPEPSVGSLAISPAIIDLDFAEIDTVALSWEMDQALEGLSSDLRVFVHLLEEPGEVLRTFDHAFPGDWVPGQRLEYELKLYQSALGPPLAPGSYALTVGLYDTAGSRWPLEAEGVEVDGPEYEVAEVRVSDRSQAPMFRFSESWAPVEAGLDRQVLGRRWLTDSGSISLAGFERPGTVWVKLLIPPVEPGTHRLVLDSGFQRTRVLIRNTCGDSEIELTGEGRHELEIPVGPFESQGGVEATECELVFEPNFHLVVPGSSESRTVLLEMLAWRGESLPPAQ